MRRFVEGSTVGSIKSAANAFQRGLNALFLIICKIVCHFKPREALAVKPCFQAVLYDPPPGE